MCKSIPEMEWERHQMGKDVQVVGVIFLIVLFLGVIVIITLSL